MLIRDLIDAFDEWECFEIGAPKKKIVFVTSHPFEEAVEELVIDWDQVAVVE